MLQKPRKFVKHLLLLCLGLLLVTSVYEAWIYFTPLTGLSPLNRRIDTVRQRIDPADFCFAVVGDNRNDRGVFPSILKKIDNDPEISFVIHLGDAVMAPRKIFYLDLARSISDRLHKPFLIIPGNHDIGPSNGYSLYEEAFGPRHYWFHLGKIRFVMADSNRLRAAPEEEKRWLRKALFQGRPGDSILVFMHVPLSDPRGKNAHHCLHGRLVPELTGIFKKAGVKRVFSGHIHGYWSGFFQGVPYTITGGGGAWLNSRDPAHGFYHYLKIRVQENRIRQEVVKVKKAFVPGLISYLYYSNLTGLELLFLISFVVSAVFCACRLKNAAGRNL